MISIACRDVLDKVLATDLVDGDQNFPANVSLPVNETTFFGSSLVTLFSEGQGRGAQQVTPIEVLTSLCLLVGIIQVSFGSLEV